MGKPALSRREAPRLTRQQKEALGTARERGRLTRDARGWTGGHGFATVRSLIERGLLDESPDGKVVTPTGDVR